LPWNEEARAPSRLLAGLVVDLGVRSHLLYSVDAFLGGGLLVYASPVAMISLLPACSL
jgi:hypothetical protein